VGLIVQPTADKARELKELGIDLSEYDVLPSTEPQSAEDFVSITDTFTNITKPEQFATQRSNNRIYENLQTSLDDKFKKIVSYD
jgi:hypothetical protein